MAKHELRDATRRQFIQGALALGAALGWGPARIWEFIDRGGGLAHADAAHPVQKLVLLIGTSGAHGYPHLLWPHPDCFTSPERYANPPVAFHVLRDASTGGRATDFGGTLKNAYNYDNMSNTKVTNGWGSWDQNERFKRVYGVDNMAFRGFKSTNGTSRNLDMTYWGLTGDAPSPSNVGADPKKNFFVVARETPWGQYGQKKWITTIDGGGINPFHIQGSHNHWVNKDKKWTVMAAAATIQLEDPTPTPVIMVGNMVSPNGGDSATFFGADAMPGAPTPATVSTAAAMVDLFNSNASRAGGLLSNPQNAVLFEAYTKGFIGSSKTAKLPTFGRGYRTSKLSSNLVGLNLAEKLLPTDTDRARYGLTANIPKAGELRDRMIVAAKALQLGLTAQVVISYFDDDPHGLFIGDSGTGGINAATAAACFGNFLNAFMDDLMAVPDPHHPELKLGDNTVVALLGDTPRTGMNLFNWNDPTYGGQNRAWIMGNGYLKTGFFGGDRSVPGDGVNTNDHLAKGPGEGGLWDLKTGDIKIFDPSGGTGQFLGGADKRIQYGETAMAAILYAVTRGQIRRVNDFYSGPDFPAVQIPVLI